MLDHQDSKSCAYDALLLYRGRILCMVIKFGVGQQISKHPNFQTTFEISLTFSHPHHFIMVDINFKINFFLKYLSSPSSWLAVHIQLRNLHSVLSHSRSKLYERLILCKGQFHNFLGLFCIRAFSTIFTSFTIIVLNILNLGRFLPVSCWNRGFRLYS